MADQHKVAKLKDAGIHDAGNLPDAVVDALASLSADELKALAAARNKIRPLGDFGGFLF